MKSFWIGLVIGLLLAAGVVIFYGVAHRSGALAAAPLMSGKLGSVRIYEKPVDVANNSSVTYLTGEVRVYDEFIVVLLPDGTKRLAAHDFYSGLSFR